MNSSKPMPMRLFSTWEVDKTTPSCIPRLCCLTLTRLVVEKVLENDVQSQSIVVALKMQSAKRVLRSNEISLPSSGLLDTELDLSFSLQYPHFLKRDCNHLQILLQRRKKYKNRTMLGYKTLAAGQVNMSHILQHSCDRELHLYQEEGKDRTKRNAMVMIMSLSSQPVDQVIERRPNISADVDRSPGEMSEEDEMHEEYSSNDDTSDVDIMAADDDGNFVVRKTRKARNRFMIRQKNFKEKFAALLKRFKVTEEVLESAVQDLGGDRESTTNYNADDLFEDVDNLTDSEPDVDTLSIRSTPKPKLRPFFSGKGGGSNICLDAPKMSSHDEWNTEEGGSSLMKRADLDTNQINERIAKPNHQNNFSSGLTDHHQTLLTHSFPPPKSKPALPIFSPLKSPPIFKTPPRRNCSSSGADKLLPAVAYFQGVRRCSMSSCETTPRRIFMDQMSSIVSSDHTSPEVIVMINSQEWHGQLLAQALQSTKHRAICTCSSSEARTVVSTIIARIQKIYKSQPQELPLKIAIVGGDSYVSSVLRPYVDMFSGKTTDWVNFVRFLIIPFGVSIIGRNLSNMDVKYASLFNDAAWKENVFERFDFSNRFNQSMDIGEVASRVVKYLNNAHQVVQLPLAEAILTNKDKGIDDSSHLIVPFLGEVRLGIMDFASVNSSALDYDEYSNVNTSLSNSPPQSSHMISHMTAGDKSRESSATASYAHTPSDTPTSSAAAPLDSFDLQVDYWLAVNSAASFPSSSRPDGWDQKPDSGLKLLGKKDLKCSLKTMFRSVQIFRNSGLQLSGDGLTGGVGQSGSGGGLSMVVVMREKKQKIMRIGKRSKESEGSKSQQIDGISRMICTSRSQNHPLNVTIDGVDWTGIKFFQVSGQWQTHVKYFPVLLFGDMSSSTMGGVP